MMQYLYIIFFNSYKYMIRRNHIETHSKIDRYALKYQSRPAHDQSREANRYAFKNENDQQYQNARLTSENKKYHQYKDMKENKTKMPFEQIKEGYKEQRKSVQVGQFIDTIKDHSKDNYRPMNRRGIQAQEPHKDIYSYNYNYKQQKIPLKERPFQNIDAHVNDQSLKRDYKYQAEDQLKVDYNSIKIKRNGVNTLHTLYNEEVKPQRERQTHVEKNRFGNQNGRVSETPARRVSFSTQKYEVSNKLQSGLSSGSKSFTPLFQDSQPYIENKYLTDRFTEQNPIPAKGQKNAYRPFTINKISEEKPNMKSLPFTAHLEKRNSISHPYNHPPTLNHYEQPKQSLKTSSQGNPLNKDKQQLSSKLKLISQFNDQINQRIKSIITCFQGLRNKY